jgi:spore maturation protein CgeB
LAKRVEETKIGSDIQIVSSKDGRPVLKIDSITFHSIYQPDSEADPFLKQLLNLKEKRGDQGDPKILVFGLGFGYHLNKIIREPLEIGIIEPRWDVLKTAMKWVDLTAVIERCELMIGEEISLHEWRQAQWMPLMPALRLYGGFFRRIQKILENPFIEKRSEITSDTAALPFLQDLQLKILVVSPLYGGSYPTAAYCEKALKKLGHQVEMIDNSIYYGIYKQIPLQTQDKTNRTTLTEIFLNFISKMLLARCVDFKPDIVLALAQAPINIETLKILKENNILTAFWFVEDYQLMQYWRSFAPYYDFYFVIQDGEFFHELDKLGVENYAYLPMAASPEVHKGMTLKEEETIKYGSPLSFVGAPYHNRIQFFKGLLDFPFKIWGDGWEGTPLASCVQKKGERVSTEESIKIFNATKINLNLHSSTYHEEINPFGDFVNPRTFEIASCGGFQLVDNRTKLPELFSPGEEVIPFRNLKELREQIRYYLDHEGEREKIAKKAQARAWREHTYEHRMQKLLSFILERKGTVLKKKSRKGEAIASMIEKLGKDSEVGKFLSQFGGKQEVTLLDIVSKVQIGRGKLKEYEAIFLLMNEFVHFMNQKKVQAS